MKKYVSDHHGVLTVTGIEKSESNGCYYTTHGCKMKVDTIKLYDFDSQLKGRRVKLSNVDYYGTLVKCKFSGGQRRKSGDAKDTYYPSQFGVIWDSGINGKSGAQQVKNHGLHSYWVDCNEIEFL